MEVAAGRDVSLGDQSLNSNGHNRKRKLPGTKLSDETVNMPREINIVDFAEYRAQEIEALTKAVMDYGTGQQVYQKLPKHMRRRAMSHNVKRLPRKLRELAQSKMKEVNRSKRPSRYYRRRPKNLLSEYSRRQQEKTWLETHIWHAKRFKMVEKWGYKIPLTPNDKSARACYRATTQHCLLQDMSYYTCLELRGGTDLINGLQTLTSPLLGPTFGAKTYLDGSREGRVMLYEAGCYPHRVIGPVTFMWKPLPSPAGLDPIRHLWMWLHPAIYDKVMQLLASLFDLKEVIKSVKETDAQCEEMDVDKSSEANVHCESIVEEEDKQTESKCKQGKKTSAVEFTNGSVSMQSLKYELLRYRLHGPLSQAVLNEALRVASVSVEINDNKDLAAQQRWEELYTDPEMARLHTKQQALWDCMKCVHSPGELTPGAVLGLTVIDPRLFLPSVRTKAVTSTDVANYSDISATRQWSSEVSTSPIWEKNIRDEVKVSKLTQHELNERRTRLLVPGSDLKLGREESKVPILLIQNPQGHGGGISSANVVSGWDVILPSSWGLAFWIAFVYRGARVGGMQENENLLAEQGALCFPNDFPDTESCRELDCEREEVLGLKHTKYPPAKRPNFRKLGVASPFHNPWSELAYQWCAAYDKESCDNNSFQWYVLRELAALQSLSQINDKISSKTLSLESFGCLDKLANKFCNCLVRVHLNMVSRGTPEMFGMICLPSVDDITNLCKDSRFGGPLEPPHKDVKDNSTSQCRDKFDAMLCSRKVIGFVSHGSFSFSQGSGTADGFCSLLGLVSLLKSMNGKHGTTVLVRNNNSLQYRWARLTIHGHF